MLETHASFFADFFFSSERPEVHEQDADSFMAFIKRWLFVVHFLVDAFAQFERYVPPGSALHPGWGVWNFSD